MTDIAGRKEMSAFNNDPQFKAQLLKMAARHRIADEYAKGTYGEEEDGKFRGCSIGCTVRDVCRITGHTIADSDHAGLAKFLLGSEELEFIPRLADAIFEGLPDPLHMQWTERWLLAIPVGATLDQLKLVLPRFLLRLMDSLPEADRADVVASVAVVKEVLRNWAHTGTPGVVAAGAAGAAQAAQAALAAAGAAQAAQAARAAAGAAGAAQAAGAARAAWIDIADDFIECLAAAPKGGE